MEVLNLIEKLKKHPELANRVSRIIDIAEDTNGDAGNAHDAEDRVTEELQKLGNEVLHDWSITKVEKLSQKSTEHLNKDVKKN